MIRLPRTRQEIYTRALTSEDAPQQSVSIFHRSALHSLQSTLPSFFSCLHFVHYRWLHASPTVAEVLIPTFGAFASHVRARKIVEGKECPVIRGDTANAHGGVRPFVVPSVRSPDALESRPEARYKSEVVRYGPSINIS